MVEPFGVTQTFCQGVGPIEIRDGMVHLVFWVEQPGSYDGSFERVLVDRLVMTQATLSNVLALMLAATGDSRPTPPAWSLGSMDGRA